MNSQQDLSREELNKLLDVYAKNWLAHDGSWFLAVEERLGIDMAIELDMRAWERFSVAEAERIMRAFEIEAGGGLEALKRALGYRLYARVNRQETAWDDDGALIFRMIECRVQEARRHKGLPELPCKWVGMVEYKCFAKTIDPRIHTECLTCPPDPVGDVFCEWRFTLSE